MILSKIIETFIYIKKYNYCYIFRDINLKIIIVIILFFFRIEQSLFPKAYCIFIFKHLIL